MKLLHLLSIFLFLQPLYAQEYRPGLFFREDFKEIPAEIPISQKHIANRDIIFAAYGPGMDSLKKSHHDTPVDDPYYLWSGLCEDFWLVTFKHKSAQVDLSSFAKIKWRTKQSGFHELRIVLKLKDGTWLISDLSDGASRDWRVSEFNISDIHWWLFDIDKMKEVRPADMAKSNLKFVEEIGCTDLMRGGGSNACSRLDWIEVYGFSVNQK